jgi:hypothetical protein
VRRGQRLTAREYHQRLEEIAKAFSGRYGQVGYGTTQGPNGATKLEVRVDIPGWGLPPIATVVFIEKHLWDPDGERYAYLYDLHLEPRPGGRFAYHWHNDVSHRHCQITPGATDHHYEGVLFDDIGWAAEELFQMAMSEISCRGLRTLRDRPPEPAVA